MLIFNNLNVICRISIDGNFLAIGSHDNCIYIYGVSDNGRKYARVGKCSVSALVTARAHVSPLNVLGGARVGRSRGEGSSRAVSLLQGHSSFITHLDWSVNSQFLVSNSGDYEILYCEWRPGARVLPQNPPRTARASAPSVPASVNRAVGPHDLSSPSQLIDVWGSGRPRSLLRGCGPRGE